LGISSTLKRNSGYVGTLQHIQSLLKPKGLFIQWDWKRTESDPDFGFTEVMIEEALLHAGFEVLSVSESFSLASESGEMQVLMGVAQKA